MKIIQNLLQKTKVSKLWFSMVIVFMVILNVSSVDAKSLKKGEEFVSCGCGCAPSTGFCIITNEGVIRVVSSNQVEIDNGGGDIFLGKYTVDGDSVRVMTTVFGTEMVMYYTITPDGLVEKKNGRVFYTKVGLAAVKNRKAEATEEKEIAMDNVQLSALKKYIGTWTDKDSYLLVEISYTGNRIRIRESYGSTATAGTEFFGKYTGERIIAVGNPKDFYKFQLPEFKLLANGEVLHDCGSCSMEDKLKKTAIRMPNVKYSPPVNGD